MGDYAWTREEIAWYLGWLAEGATDEQAAFLARIAENWPKGLPPGRQPLPQGMSH